MDSHWSLQEQRAMKEASGSGRKHYPTIRRYCIYLISLLNIGKISTFRCYWYVFAKSIFRCSSFTERRNFASLARPCRKYNRSAKIVCRPIDSSRRIHEPSLAISPRAVIICRARGQTWHIIPHPRASDIVLVQWKLICRFRNYYTRYGKIIDINSGPT